VQRQDVSHCTCRGCGVTLMYTRGATSVSCGACHAVTNTAGIAAEREGNSKMNSGDEERELVVVENPPVKLRDGRVMPNVSVAVEIHSAKNTKK
jgi:LSD1 subclass zinc finger protein